MTDKSLIHRYLDPGDALGEVLFGLIMVLSFTVVNLYLSHSHRYF